jgi:hypothetical protein
LAIGFAYFGRETTVKRQTNQNLKNEFPNIEDLSTLFAGKFSPPKSLFAYCPNQIV